MAWTDKARAAAAAARRAKVQPKGMAVDSVRRAYLRAAVSAARRKSDHSAMTAHLRNAGILRSAAARKDLAITLRGLRKPNQPRSLGRPASRTDMKYWAEALAAYQKARHPGRSR